MFGDRRSAASTEATSLAERESQSSASQISQDASLPNRGRKDAPDEKLAGVSFIDGIKSIQLSELKEIHKKPCAREAFLIGISAAFGVGGFSAVLGARVLIACNWAVGSFVLGSGVMHEYCQWRRREEKQNYRRLVEVVDRKRAEEKLRALEAKDQGGAKK